jgi:hypothetical protein
MGGRLAEDRAGNNRKIRRDHLTWTHGLRDNKSGFVRKWIRPRRSWNEEIGHVKRLAA